jgi:rRNA small subunit methyltransferase G
MLAAEQAWLQQTLCGPLGLRINDDQARRLLGYIDLLQHWNSTYNLTAVRERPAMLTQHLADGLAVVPSLLRHLETRALPGTPRLLDVGSGGGLPGALLAIVLPHLHVTCVDTVGKKAAFVRQVAGAQSRVGARAGRTVASPALRRDHGARLCLVGRFCPPHGPSLGAGRGVDGDEGQAPRRRNR